MLPKEVPDHPDKEDSYVLEMKPVVPFRLSDDWTLITRTIIPVILGWCLWAAELGGLCILGSNP